MPNEQEQDQGVALGAPGIDPSWQRGDKDGVGTAYSASSQLWFTIWNGIVTEVYAPTVDRPQIRDLQLLFYDEQGFVLPEISMDTSIHTIDDSLGYRICGKSEEGVQFSYEKEIICDPHRACLLLRIAVHADEETKKRLRVCVLCAPHLGTSGRNNNAQVKDFVGKQVLVAEREGEAFALAVEGDFNKASVGYVGKSDAWTDLHQNHAMTWSFRSAPNGNVALAGEVSIAEHSEFTIFLAFGRTLHNALASILQSAALPYADTRRRFIEQWDRLRGRFADLEPVSHDKGALYRMSTRLLLAHEDKLYAGAIVASLAIPWGEARGDENGRGGYHLIWTRDLVQSALGLMAAGQRETPLRAFLYLAASQENNGSFPQNFWVDGTPYWHNVQLDEVAFPLILAHRLWKEGIVSMEIIREVGIRAVSFLLVSGPITQQERWEEAYGLSPSTLAVVINALICAAEMAESTGDHDAQALIESYADWIESQLETWTATHTGTLLQDVPDYYVRINPVPPGSAPPASVDGMQLTLNNIPPGMQFTFPAKDIIDTGFLELVRYGIRDAKDPLILSSIRVVDAQLRVETPSGVLWHRYNHDGYGQQDDGASFVTYGRGRGWPLLVGERGQYEIAAGASAAEYIGWMEELSTPTMLLPEQSWDTTETPDSRQRPGRPTGSAVPLLWAHAEYIRLLRSACDGRVFDLNERVRERYVGGGRPKETVYFWTFACPIATVPAGFTVRLIAEADFEVVYSHDGWKTQSREASARTKIRAAFHDIKMGDAGSELRFTFYWTGSNKWEGRDFVIKAV